MMRANQIAGLFARPAIAAAIALIFTFTPSSHAESRKAASPGVRATVLGVVPGMELEEAIERLDRAARADDDDDRVAEGEEEREEPGSRKLAWALPDGTFRNVALKADREEKVVWVTGFLRPGHEVPFAQLGDSSAAARVSDTEMIWNFKTADGNRRVVAKGHRGRASVITIMSTDLSPIE